MAVYDMACFFEYCKQNDVDIMPYSGMPYPAATIRDGKFYCVAMDFGRLRTIRAMRTATMHEQGHLITGALRKTNSPFQIVQQSEYRADADSFRRYLPPGEIEQAVHNGYTESWQLAEYFDLDQPYIERALHYWTECRGINFNEWQTE